MEKRDYWSEVRSMPPVLQDEWTCCAGAIVVGVIILILYILFKFATPISIWSAGRNVRKGLENQKQVQYVYHQTPYQAPPPQYPPQQYGHPQAAQSPRGAGTTTGRTARFCEDCGTPLKPTSRYCEQCGHLVR
jgi:hypothetical protein